MAYTRFSFRDDEERIEFLIALPVLAFFGFLLYHFVFSPESSDTGISPGFALAANQGSDIDGDGVADGDDHCTAIAGPHANFGCPSDQTESATNTTNILDSDADGVTDAADRCPQDAGLITEFGCPTGTEQTTHDGDAEMPAETETQGAGIVDKPQPAAAPPAEEPAIVDSDGDGVADNDDQCPAEAGVAANSGCPADSDGDGVIDDDDLCPQSSGVAENRGCPADSDTDGLPDNQDQCPEQRGPLENGGCPIADQDNDGVADESDQCIDVAGDAANNGCPAFIDSDGDGIADADDSCPQEDGAGSEDGCPVEDSLTVESLGTEITFETASATLTEESRELLDVVASILQKYPAVKLLVEGHTDDLGQADINLRLSEQRARACTTYLARQGIAEDRMQAIGYGDTRPLVTNDSAEARKQNRRVEFKLTN